MTTELTLLPQVAYGGQEVSSPRLRALLALLAGDLRAGCSTGRLVEGLWPDEQPENPAKALQVLVSRARALLGADVLASTPIGYRLTLDEERVDSSAVLRRSSESAHESRAGHHAAALAKAEAGLALYDGVVGVEGALDDPLAMLRADRASTYRSLERARALALSRLGRHAEAFEALVGVFGERPRDEEVLRELLLSEAATQGAPAALKRYEAYRRSVRDELGTDPGAGLQEIHERLLQDVRPWVRHGVPHEPNPLLGREDDIAAVLDRLHSSRVTSIVGAGGLGKTRLAHVVSRQAEQRIVHFVALAGVSADADVVREVASALGVGEVRASAGPVGVPLDAVVGIAGALGQGPALLVLDNCEHVVRGAAELVQSLVSLSRHLRVLTTSRTPLDLSSESVYQLPALDLATSVELFNRRARAARAGVELPADTVEELCGQLDGLPLAVELAAARVRVMSVTEIARRLDDRLGLLRGGPRDAPERHRTLHAVIDWSWALLQPQGQAAMRALSVFPGGFTEDAARHVLGVDALPVLEHLVDQSLLDVVDTPTGTRFRMLETVREFAAAHRAEAGEGDRAVDGLLAWARDFGIAHHQGVFGAEPFPDLERIRAEQDNLVLALRHALDREDGATVAAATALLATLWSVDSSYMRIMTLVEETGRLLSHYRPESDLVEITRTALALCSVNTFLIEGPRAIRAMAALRRLAPAPPTTLARAVSIVLAAVRDITGADSPALQVLCDSDEPLLAGVANTVATFLAEGDGDLIGASRAAERALVAFESDGSLWMRVLAHSRIGELSGQLERGADAVHHLRAALRLQHHGGARPPEIGLRWGLVLANLQLGAVDEAAHWLEQAVSNQVDEDAVTGTFGIGVRAEIALSRGDQETGLQLWRSVADQCEGDFAEFRTDAGEELPPWALELRAAAVVAHAQHGRLDLVEEITPQLPETLTTMLRDPITKAPPYVLEFSLCGALLLALAMVDIDRGARTSDTSAISCGVRMIALAERFRFPRTFHPTMSSGRARAAAEQADKLAYDDAVSSYAELDRDALRLAALAVLQERVG